MREKLVRDENQKSNRRNNRDNGAEKHNHNKNVNIARKRISDKATVPPRTRSLSDSGQVLITHFTAAQSPTLAGEQSSVWVAAAVNGLTK